MFRGPTCLVSNTHSNSSKHFDYLHKKARKSRLERVSFSLLLKCLPSFLAVIVTFSKQYKILLVIKFLQWLPGRGLAVNFCKKCGEMQWKKFFAVTAVNDGELFIFTAFNRILTKKKLRDMDLKLSPRACLQFLIPTVTYFSENYCEFKSDSINVMENKSGEFFEKCDDFCGDFLWEMRWNAVNYFFFTAFNAITAFITKRHRIHRISCKNSHKKFDPGIEQNQKKFKNKIIYSFMSTCIRLIFWWKDSRSCTGPKSSMCIR